MHQNAYLERYWAKIISTYIIGRRYTYAYYYSSSDSRHSQPRLPIVLRFSFSRITYKNYSIYYSADSHRTNIILYRSAYYCYATCRKQRLNLHSKKASAFYSTHLFATYEETMSVVEKLTLYNIKISRYHIMLLFGPKASKIKNICINKQFKQKTNNICYDLIKYASYETQCSIKKIKNKNKDNIKCIIYYFIIHRFNGYYCSYYT